jgi:hypothetical protein
MAPLCRFIAEHLPAVAPRFAEKYTKGERSDVALFVPKQGAPPPSPRLDPKDLETLVPPDALSDASWCIIENTILLSRRPESLGRAVDHLKALYAGAAEPGRAPVESVIPAPADGVDIVGGFTNEHGELAALLTILADATDAPGLAAWLATEQATRDVATFSRGTIKADVQTGDQVQVTTQLEFASYVAAARVFAVLYAALERYRPPPPITLKLGGGLRPNRVTFDVRISGLGAYLDNWVWPKKVVALRMNVSRVLTTGLAPVGE